MKYSRLGLIAIVLALILLFSAVLHLNAQKEIPEDAVLLTAGTDNHSIPVCDLAQEWISGVRVNGKGEEIPVSGEGISLSQLLEQYDIHGYNSITILSSDSYSAKIMSGEAEKACFLLEDGQMRLIVFGDSNSKRSVSSVKEIIVE